MNQKIWLSPPHMGGAEQKYIQEAFDSNWIAPKGVNIDLFEEGLADYLGNKNQVVALNSGTSAIHLALILLGVSKDDEVLCQSFSYCATANPIIYQGATPVFIDSETETWNMCPVLLEEAIIDRIEKGKKPKAILAVHGYGMPYNVIEIEAASKKYGIPVIEDAASALGSSVNDQTCGTFGTIGIISFNGNKIITTSGGGALICKNKEQKQKAIFLGTQARDDAPHYQHSEIGYNYRMSNVLAGIGRGQLEVLGSRVEARRAIHAFYKDVFVNNPSVALFEVPSEAYCSNYWLSAVLLSSYEEREALRLHMKTANIETRPLWKPLHLQPIFKQYPYYGTLISEDLFKRGLCLPSGSNLSNDDLIYIKEQIELFFIKIK